MLTETERETDETTPSPLAREMAELIRQIVRDELRQAKGERHRLENELAAARAEVHRFVQRRDEMKREAGYPIHESFDNVWRDVLERANANAVRDHRAAHQSNTAVSEAAKGEG